MQVRIEDVSPVEKKLIVEVPWATVSTKLGDAYRELARTVSLKGFRRGKVPRSVLERMFGKRVRAEVAEKLVRESFLTAAAEHQLQAVSEPVVQDAPQVKRGEPFSFEALIEVKGAIGEMDIDGFELAKRPVEVPDDAVTRALELVQREQTELMPIEGRDVTASTDVVAISVKGAVGEHVIDRPQLTLDLGDRAHEPLPGLAAALTGLPLSLEDHRVELEIPKDHGDEDIAGKTAALTVSILDARRKEVPALDDELAKDTGRAETLDGLRQVLREELEARMRDDIEDEVREAALKELVKRNRVPVAASLVERAVESKYHRLQMMLGIPHEHGAEPELPDEMRERLSEGAEDEVRGQLLLEALADKESIEVAEEALDRRIAELARRQGQAPGKLKAEMNRDGRLDNLRFQLRQENALDLIVSRATITERAAEAEQASSESKSAESPQTPESGEVKASGAEPASAGDSSQPLEEARADAAAEDAGNDAGEDQTPGQG